MPKRRVYDVPKSFSAKHLSVMAAVSPSVCCSLAPAFRHARRVCVRCGGHPNRRVELCAILRALLADRKTLRAGVVTSAGHPHLRAHDKTMPGIFPTSDKLYCIMNDLGEKALPRLEPGRVSLYCVGAEQAGQRIDNFLLRLAKGVPKSHVYRVIRGGEVRVNRKRVDVTYRLVVGDEIRLPPIRTATLAQAPVFVRPVEFPVVFEDDHLLVIDKPAGVAVHGGSGVAFGVIEQLRAARPEGRFLELVHRLDRDTSGVLVLAKRRSSLVALHRALREGETDKRYLALVRGQWPNQLQHVKTPLTKYLLPGGERRVRVDEKGVTAHTVLILRERFMKYTLLEVLLKTGRTHQIRVHLEHVGFPIVGDEKYGDFALNRELAKAGAKLGLRRMFLHSWRLGIVHPATGQELVLEAPLPRECSVFVEGLEHV